MKFVFKLFFVNYYVMLLRRFFITGILIYTGTFAIAQQDSKQYQFRRIDIGKGLSHNQVNTILKDSRGFMWFGTMSGLNRYDGNNFKIFKHNSKDSSSIDDDYITRIGELPGYKLLVETHNGRNIYDPLKEKFDRHTQAFFKGLSLPDTSILQVITTRQGDFYLLFALKGLYKYNSASKQSVRINAAGKSDITAISQNSKGDLWLICRDGVLEKLDVASNRIVYRTRAVAEYMHGELLDYAVLADSDDELWIYTLANPMGVLHFKPAVNQVVPFNKEAVKFKLNTNLVMGMLQDNQGHIWVSTDHGGVNVINKKNYAIQYLLNNPDDNASLSQNSIIASYKDDQGILWIGTYKKGIDYFHESIIKFPLYRHQPSNPNSLSYDDVNRFAEDAKGNIWIGSNGGGLIYFDRAAGTFTTHRHQPGNTNSLINDVIVSLCLDKKGKLWIGTYFGGLDCYDGKTFTHYQHNPADNTTIADNRIWEIYEDRDSTLWIGTLAGGLDRFDRDKNIFYHYTASQPNAVRANYIAAIAQNRAGDLWVGTNRGCDVLEKTSGRFVHYTYDAANAASLSNWNVFTICMDSRDRHWIGTGEGLNLFNRNTQRFQHFTIEEGLPDNTILNVLEDNKHTLWVSTPKGISNVLITDSVNGQVKISCKNYDETDGLQGIEFNENAALKTSRGELIFGGPNGFNIFQPQNISSVKQVPKIVFTDFQLFNKSIFPDEEINGTVLLPQSITETRSVTLNYDENVIAIEFAALNYANAEKNKYACKLEGFKNEWLITDGKSRKATYTNLDPGEYIFHVRTANDDGTWNNNDIQLRILIRPPFWQSPLAYVLYFLVIVASLYIGRLIIIRKTREKFALEQERLEAQRMHELDLMKIKFFTNVSHEFRTPLSLIISPAEKLIKESVAPNDKKQFQLIIRNARRLLNLVNQLLDFRKLEEQELKLNTNSGDMISFIKEIAYSFSDIAENKQIAFSFVSAENRLFTTFDQDKLERILFNLLSNAFKFTPVEGFVKVVVESGNRVGERTIQIKVLDNGIGIPADKQEKIFERFFQNEIPSTMVNQGSGIGLAITKEFVRLHGGTITVESEVDKGSCFTVTLPVMPIPMETIEILKPETEQVPEAERVTENLLTTNAAEKNGPFRKKTLLLVEDNEDFRFYIKDNLKTYYTIIEAANGKTGWQKTLAEHPDLVVCDISMPEMSGIELCKKIKNDDRTSFIPVILLTALTGEEQQLAGLQTGASDYVTKPFNFEILLSKIRNLLLQQESFKKVYQKQVHAHPSEVKGESADEKFIQQALAVIEKNISNADFSVEEMSREMFMSRVALYKKLFNLTGKTPIEFIRSIRLQRAAQLLRKREMTVAEVAYEVGFNNPKYFSKYFKMEYNVLPSAYTGENESSNN